MSRGYEPEGIKFRKGDLSCSYRAPKKRVLANDFCYITDSGINTLKTYGNLLISFEHFDKMISNSYNTLFRRSHGIKPVYALRKRLFEDEGDYRSVWNMCLEDMNYYITKMTGIENIKYIWSPKPEPVDDCSSNFIRDCVIIEDADNYIYCNDKEDLEVLMR